MIAGKLDVLVLAEVDRASDDKTSNQNVVLSSG